MPTMFAHGAKHCDPAHSLLDVSACRGAASLFQEHTSFTLNL